MLESATLQTMKVSGAIMTYNESEIVQKAINIIDMSSIDSKDINRMKCTKDIANEQEAKLALVEEFLELELKMDINDLMYVKFHDNELIKEIYKQAARLPKSGKSKFQLQNYIPKEMYPRFRAMKDRCKELMNENDNTQTKDFINDEGL